MDAPESEWVSERACARACVRVRARMRVRVGEIRACWCVRPCVCPCQPEGVGITVAVAAARSKGLDSGPQLRDEGTEALERGNCVEGIQVQRRPVTVSRPVNPLPTEPRPRAAVFASLGRMTVYSGQVSAGSRSGSGIGCPLSTAGPEHVT